PAAAAPASKRARRRRNVSRERAPFTRATRVAASRRAKASRTSARDNDNAVKLLAFVFALASCDAERIDFTTGADTSPDVAVFADGGFVSTPDAIACGASACDPLTAFCCALPNGSTTALSCQTSGGNCPNGGVMHCDEAADCPSGNVCCWDTSSGVL